MSNEAKEALAIILTIFVGIPFGMAVIAMLLKWAGVF